ncbi:hypothetical protein GCM10023205_65390 [Yinghuangia aomiensis]|uniref:Cellulose binding domain-containing protein n=1 Tax=Yinghuangia aomiensis TaxID=676205 RepID=A0ABP9I2L4_9ACTN
MGRHGDRAADGGTSGRRGRGDGTAQGVALPLVIAAVVCLLATSGVWLFRGGDSGKDKTPIGLNVPSVTVSQPEPTQVPGTATGSPSAAPETTGTASASAKPTKTTAAPTTKPPSTTAKPPTSAPPPPTTAPPKPYAASGSASYDRWNDYVTLTVTVSNPNSAPLGQWTVGVGGSRVSGAWMQSGPPGAQGTRKGATGSGPVAGGTSFRLVFVVEYQRNRPSSITVDVNGATTNIDVDDGW